jgi:hypothetical protein
MHRNPQSEAAYFPVKKTGSVPGENQHLPLICGVTAEGCPALVTSN